MYISTGEQITADVDKLAQKIDYVTGKISRNLTKAQKDAGAQLNFYGELVNRQGKLVEGLTLSQVKLGQYVDEMGKVHTANGEYVADLNRIEQHLGFYADELGNVYNAQGKQIRKTAEATRAASEQLKIENELIKSGQRFSESWASSLNGFSSAFGQFATLLSTIQGSSGELSAFSSQLLSISQFLSTFSAVYGNVTSLAKGFQNVQKSSEIYFKRLKELSSSANKSVAGLLGSFKKMSPAVAALGGPIGIATAGVTAIGAGIMAYKASNSINDKLSDSFKELEKRAKAAGDTIKGVGDALKNTSTNSNRRRLKERSDRPASSVSRRQSERVA